MVDKLKEQIPDVITLDLEMPRMDGLTFLQKIMSRHPIPVIICSTLTENGSESAMKALELCAVDIITKPKVGTKLFLEESQIQICDIVKAASLITPKRISANKNIIQPKLNADVIISKPKGKLLTQTTEKVIAVGASTGGTEALKYFLEEMPMNAPGIVIVQHMPENFTKAFANRLNSSCKITVKEAEYGDSVITGRTLIAPGNKHLLLKRSGARYYVEIKEGPLVSRHRPSVDVLFSSVARYAGKNAIGIIMTVMGDDGAKGMLEMKENGAYTIAQGEKSCVVYGMPKEAVKLGAVDDIVPLNEINHKLIGKKLLY
jgi:two-component system, chemotaxis family, protein-glutamate methylesterase/glutaminase